MDRLYKNLDTCVFFYSLSYTGNSRVSKVSVTFFYSDLLRNRNFRRIRNSKFFSSCRQWTERIYIAQVRYTNLFVNVKVQKNGSSSCMTNLDATSAITKNRKYQYYQYRIVAKKTLTYD